MTITVCSVDAFVVVAENIPRTLCSVYQRAQKLFDPKRRTERWAKQSLAIQNVTMVWSIKLFSRLQLI